MTNEQADAIASIIFEGFQKVADAIDSSALSEERLYDISYALEAIAGKLTNINETLRDVQ
jgi:hypothetical protein